MAEVIRFRSGKATAAVKVYEPPLLNLFDVAGRRVAHRTAKDIEAEAKRRAPVRTGRLRASIHANPPRRIGKWKVEARVTAAAPYARFVHEGTRPHLITPRRPGGVLRFESHGRTVFAKRVHHPGTRPNPFLQIAAREVAARRR